MTLDHCHLDNKKNMQDPEACDLTMTLSYCLPLCLAKSSTQGEGKPQNMNLKTSVQVPGQWLTNCTGHFTSLGCRSKASSVNSYPGTVPRHRRSPGLSAAPSSGGFHVWIPNISLRTMSYSPSGPWSPAQSLTHRVNSVYTQWINGQINKTAN